MAEDYTGFQRGNISRNVTLSSTIDKMTLFQLPAWVGRVIIRPRVSDVKAIMDTEVAEVTTILCVAEGSGVTGGDFFDYSTPNSSYRFWCDVDDGSTAPAAGGRTLVEFDVSALDADTVVATAVQTAMDAQSDITATVNSATVTATCDEVGAATDADDGTAATTFTITTTQQGRVEDDVLIASLPYKTIDAGDDRVFVLRSSAARPQVWPPRIAIAPTVGSSVIEIELEAF